VFNSKDDDIGKQTWWYNTDNKWLEGVLLNNNVWKPEIIQKNEVEKKDVMLEKNDKPDII
jgi:hypothetical protein